MRKGITPVIAIIVLLFITIALAGAAWTYMQGFLFTQISKSFQIPTNGVYCEDGTIKVYVINTAYQGTLTAEDFVLHDIDGTNVDLDLELEIPQGEATRVMEVPDQDSGYHTVNLGTSSTVVHQRVYCP